MCMYICKDGCLFVLYHDHGRDVGTVALSLVTDLVHIGMVDAVLISYMELWLALHE